MKLNCLKYYIGAILGTVTYTNSIAPIIFNLVMFVEINGGEDCVYFRCGMG